MSRLWSKVLFALAACNALPVLASDKPVEIQGQIVYVEDGDTLTLLDDSNTQIKVRLTDLDAPESPKPHYGKLGQPFSRASKNNLVELAKGKPANAVCYELDTNGRSVCRVFVGGTDLSLKQIQEGFAWANGASRRFVRDNRAYQYQEAAKRAKIGLWRDPAPIEPWKWRRECWGANNCSGAGE